VGSRLEFFSGTVLEFKLPMAGFRSAPFTIAS
jgi:hypothetical protein